MNVSDPPIVDLHVHLFPDRMFEAVWEWFESRDWAVHHEYVDDVAQTLEAHGVGLATGLSYPHKPGVAASLNEFMAGVGERHPRFLPFASVHVGDDDLRRLVDRALGSPNLHGFKFQPLVQRFDVNDPRLDYLYERSVEADFPLMMHLGTAPITNDYVGFVHFKRLITRYPELRVCIAHMGAFEFDDFLSLLDHHAGLFLDTTMINVQTHLFDTTWRGDRERLASHADRICFGSDWPQVPYPYQEALDSVARFPLPEGARAGVLGANARRFLKLDS